MFPTKNLTASSATKSVVDSTPEKTPAENFGASVRELFESISIALVLAFLFRAFLAEMFVIPTGSMAPTLMGQHKDVTCPECGTRFQVGVMAGSHTDYGLCPNCTLLMDFQAEAKKGHSNPNFSGDRILVGKYPYYFSHPKRWDVVVFLFPGGANTNFIKRCVGLPGETIRIHGGNIFVKPPKAELERLEKHDAKIVAKLFGNQTDSVPVFQREPFQIARKPPEKIVATMIPVYKNDFQSLRLRKVGARSRWHQLNNAQILNDSIPYTAWKEHNDGKEFYFKPERADEMTGWLVYQNLVLSQDLWHQVEMGQTPDLKPRLITDMTAYNTALGAAEFSDSTENSATTIPIPSYNYGRHWVKDLILECTIDVRSLKTGEFTAGINRGNKTFWCKIDLNTGKVLLEIPARPDFGADIEKQIKYDQVNKNSEYVAHADSPMNGTDIYRFRMANVDDQIHVWIDGKVLKFDLPTAYKMDPASDFPTADDLQKPIQIGCKNCEVNLSRLNVYRDIYYVARGRENMGMCDFERESAYGGMQEYTPDFDFYSDPFQWEAFKSMRTVEFELDENGERKYFMMGDNSTNSADCRCWTYPEYDPRRASYVSEYYVPESLLVGEAYYVYWPHAWKPFWPNFGKFRFIK